LFITAGNATLATINELLIKSYSDGNEEPPKSSWPREHLCIITNVGRKSGLGVGSKFASGPADPPLEALPALPKELLHASPEACMAFARSHFPADTGLLEWDKFMIVDELTETQKTVMIGANDGYRGLVLQRHPFDFSLRVFTWIENTARTIDEEADRASRTDSGVNRPP
jgi:hypothetical protein